MPTREEILQELERTGKIDTSGGTFSSVSPQSDPYTPAAQPTIGPNQSIPQPDAPSEIGGFDRFLLGSGAQYLSPEQRSDARWYGILSALGSIPQRGLLGAIPAGMEGGRSAVDYENALENSREWQGRASDEAHRAAMAGDIPGYERWVSAFYGDPGKLPKVQYPPHTLAYETVAVDPNGNPIDETKMVAYDPSVGTYVAKKIPGLGLRKRPERNLQMMSPYQEAEVRRKDLQIMRDRQDYARLAQQGQLHPGRGLDPSFEKVAQGAREPLSFESPEEYFGYVNEWQRIYPGRSGTTMPGPLGGAPAPPSRFQGPSPPTMQDRLGVGPGAAPAPAEDPEAVLRQKYGLPVR